MLTTTFLVIIIFLIFLYFKNKLNYWTKHGVPNTNPITPLGDLLKCIVYRKNLFDVLIDHYQAFKKKGYKFAGFYYTTGPLLIPIDVELIKRIFITDYDHFQDRGMYSNKEKLYLSDNVVCTNYIKWKPLKEMMNAITTSSKTNNSIPIAQVYAEKFLKVMDTKSSVDVFNLAGKYILDAMSDYYAGVKEHSLEKNSTPMFECLHKMSSVSWSNLFKIFVRFGTTNPAQLFMGLLMVEDIPEFFKSYVRGVYEMRKTTKIERRDALNHFINCHDNNPKDFDFQSLVNQVFLLYAATYDTSSYTTIYVLYEIGKSKHFQDKIRREIQEVLKKSDGQINPDSLANMTFLHRFIIETVRYHPLVPLLFRRCNKDYKIDDSDCIIKKGTQIILPVPALHNDEELFPNPKEFNPDRYIDRHRKQYLMTFGIGPKQCPGEKLAFTLIKILVIKILSHYQLSIDYEKTGKDLESVIFTKQFMWTYKNKIWINFDALDETKDEN